MRQARNIVWGLYTALFIIGCTPNLANLDSFEARAGYAALLITKVANTSAERYEQGAMSKNQGTQALRVLKNAQELLELANTANKAGNVTDADATLAAAIAVLTRLEQEIGK